MSLADRTMTSGSLRRLQELRCTAGARRGRRLRSQATKESDRANSLSECNQTKPQSSMSLVPKFAQAASVNTVR
jgi:hypothetical protein